MSEWFVRVVELGKIGRHPNADTLGITTVEGQPVIVKDGFFKPGDRAVYVPIDSIVPHTEDNVSMFGSKLRVRAKKIRGIFSRGYLMPMLALPDSVRTAPVGAVVHTELSISKWEPPLEKDMNSRGRAEAGPKHFVFPEYTDICGLRKYRSEFESHPTATRDVVITEKIHGSNARFCHDGTRLWVGSRGQVKARPEPLFPGDKPKGNWWWTVVEKLGLEEKLARCPLTVFYGEVFGKGVQDLNYGTDITLRIFDTLDGRTGNYNDWDITRDIVAQAGLELVPTLYRGMWGGFEAHLPLAEGPTTFSFDVANLATVKPADHVREGFVVKPAHEMWDPAMGRVIFKVIGEGYDLR